MNYTKVDSPNVMSRNGHKPLIIVNHIGEGSYKSNFSWLTNPNSEVSSNFIVGEQGEVAYIVDITKSAWCNGTTTNPSGTYYVGRSTNRIVKDMWTNANYFSVSIEHSGFYKNTGGALTEKQYQATLDVHKFIIKEVERIYKHRIPLDREHIIGHYEVAPKEKPNCPGHKFPWTRLINDLKSWNYGETTERLSTEDFILKIKDSAVNGWKTHRILPSLTIAQAILESDSGNSELATKANALFGIKAHTDPLWVKTYQKLTYEYSNGEKIQVTAKFKAYDNWEQSLKDRLSYLTTRKINDKYIYTPVIGENDYKQACNKIFECGYATDPKYPQKLISIIEKYNLFQYDKISKGDFVRVVAYVNDGDLANALALVNGLAGSILIRTDNATGLGDEIVQVGGATVKGATVVLAGKDRRETLDKVNEYIKKNK